MRLDWTAITIKAAAIVESYDTPVTLRQLFYRLVAAELLPNTTTAYKTLSSRTAELSREGCFPDFSDRTRVNSIRLQPSTGRRTRSGRSARATAGTALRDRDIPSASAWRRTAWWNS